jgi:diguanylate cyclase (GGDEF)-like protein
VTRRELARHLQDMLAGGAGAHCGVLLLRLQRLRDFRQVHGFSAGDLLIEAAQARIAAVLRPGDVLQRLGEHEFALLLPRLHDANHALLAASRVVRGFEEPLQLDARSVLASIAAGASVYPQHGNDAETLLRRAELALGAAERSNDRTSLYLEGSERKLVPYEWLQRAITENRLEIYLQPIVDLRGDAIIGAEALTRWPEPGRGLIPPDTFIPLAEETGLISGLTRWCVHAALRHAAQAQQALPGFNISINLSPRVFGERDLVSHIESALSVWNVAPSAVTLEVTESALMDDPGIGLRLLQQLRDIGLHISIDDFGAGYSSFAYLRRFPATQLKIDRSFVTDMRSDPRSVKVVRSIIDLGHHLGLEVVAEGVEDATTLALLRGLDCDRAQGQHIRSPEPAGTFIASLTAAPNLAS